MRALIITVLSLLLQQPVFADMLPAEALLQGRFLQIDYYTIGTVTTVDEGKEPEVLQDAGYGELHSFMLHRSDDGRYFFFFPRCDLTTGSGSFLDLARGRQGVWLKQGSEVPFDLGTCSHAIDDGYSVTISIKGAAAFEKNSDDLSIAVKTHTDFHGHDAVNKIKSREIDTAVNGFSIRFSHKEDDGSLRRECEVAAAVYVSEGQHVVDHYEDGPKFVSQRKNDRKLHLGDTCREVPPFRQ